jgi:CRP-like cAMP-binding protein
MTTFPNQDLLHDYIKQYSLDTLFETDMSRYMTLLYFPKGDFICESSDKLDSFYFLVSGKLKTFTLLDNGKSLLLRFSKPLGVIGDLEFLSRLPVRCHVEAQIDSYLIRIHFSDLYQHAYNDPTFLRFIISHLSYKLYTASNAASLNQLYPLENRFASYLLSINTDENNETRIEEIKANKLTEIAMLLGTSYRHLNRVIRQFREESIISQDKGSLKVLDLPKLRTLAKENIYE